MNSERRIRSKTGRSPAQHPNAVTLIELLVTLSILSVLFFLFLPAVARAKRQATRIACLSQLKQIGIAHHLFAHEHFQLFPAEVSTNHGGAREFLPSPFGPRPFHVLDSRFFLPLSNFLVTPRILVCPADHRNPAPQFASLNRSQLSYFTGLQARWDSPDSVLSGDRNLKPIPMLDRVQPAFSERRAVWSKDLHRGQGNLLFADGRVETLSSPMSIVPVRSAPVLSRGPSARQPRSQPSPIPNVRWGPSPGIGTIEQLKRFFRIPSPTSPPVARRSSNALDPTPSASNALERSADPDPLPAASPPSAVAPSNQVASAGPATTLDLQETLPPLLTVKTNLRDSGSVLLTLLLYALLLLALLLLVGLLRQRRRRTHLAADLDLGTVCDE